MIKNFELLIRTQARIALINQIANLKMTNPQPERLSSRNLMSVKFKSLFRPVTDQMSPNACWDGLWPLQP